MAITGMETVTQQNAALVEQAAAAAGCMQEQAGKLAQLVSRFRLGGENRAAVAQGARRSMQQTQRVALSR